MDTSLRSPDGGYILPLISPAFIRDPTQEAIRLAPVDQRFADAWTFLARILDRRDIRSVVGVDLDRLAARYGLTRQAGERDDEVFRARVIGTIRHGLLAASGPNMRTWLTAITGVPLLAENDPTTPGRASIIFLSYPPQGVGIVPLIQARLALGRDCSVVARGPGAFGLLDTFTLDSEVLDGGNAYVVLYAPPVAVVQTGLLDTFTLDTTTI